MISYNLVTGPSTYVLSNNSAEFDDYMFQIDIYTDPSKASEMDAIVARVKTVMESLSFMSMSGGNEFLEPDINKVVRPTRWEITNA